MLHDITTRDETFQAFPPLSVSASWSDQILQEAAKAWEQGY